MERTDPLADDPGKAYAARIDAAADETAVRAVLREALPAPTVHHRIYHALAERGRERIARLKTATKADILPTADTGPGKKGKAA
jgi:hypothetical protein